MGTGRKEMGVEGKEGTDSKVPQLFNPILTTVLAMTFRRNTELNRAFSNQQLITNETRDVRNNTFLIPILEHIKQCW